MSKFLRMLDLRPQYGQVDATDGREVRAMARLVARRLAQVLPLKGAGTIPLINNRQMQLVEEFRALARDPKTTQIEFARVMGSLLQWAGQPVTCAESPYGTAMVCGVILEDL